MMSEHGLTRRALLSASAGVLAAGAARPHGVLAAVLRAPEPKLRGPEAELLRSPEPELWELTLGALRPGGTTITLRRNADLVGVTWNGPFPRVQLRVRTHGGRWSRWVSATGCAGEHGSSAHPHPRQLAEAGEQVGDPVWTGGSSELQLRSSRALSGVRLQLVDVSAGLGAHRRALSMDALSASALPLASPVLEAGPGQPPIIAREAWAQGMAHPAVAPEYGSVRMAFVHHTENPNGYAPAEVPAMLLAIYVFHRYVRGWDDIGYNFVVDLFGRIFEARAGGIDEPVVGAQAGGYNEVSTGAAALGTFSSVPISAPARHALERLLAWKLALHGVPAQGRVTVRVDPAGASYSRFPGGAHVSLPRIAGHRDADSTECPGDVLYGELPSMRPRVARLAGHPARATLALQTPRAVEAPATTQMPQTAPAPQTAEPPPTAEAPQTPAAAGEAAQHWTLSGRLVRLDGTPVVGAPIAVQERNVSHKGESVEERTVTQALTGSEGEWSLPATITARRGGTWLRALSVGANAGNSGSTPVAVSEPLHVRGMLAPASAPAAPATGPEPTVPAAS
jgi:N-acetylmuramoyl-L-alanine amidase